MPHEGGGERVGDRADVDPVAILAGGRAVSGVEPGRHPGRREDDNFRPQHPVQRPLEAAQIEPVRGIERGHLGPGVDSGVGSAGHRKGRPRAQDPGQRPLEGALHGPDPGLPGPPSESRPVVGQDQLHDHE